MIKDIQHGKVTIDVEVVKVEEPRIFSKFGKQGVVVDIIVKDDSGEMTLVLFENTDLKEGQMIRLQGFAKNYKDQLQLYLGRLGSIEVIQNI